MSDTPGAGGPGSPTAQGHQDPRRGLMGGGWHLTRGFTNSFPVTVNMVERPNGVHTVGERRG